LELLRPWIVVLVSPKEPGNVGGVARVVKNLGAGGLRVVAPRCEVNGPDSRRFSSGAAELLRAAPVFETLAEAIADRELVIGLTGVNGRHHRVDCVELVPQSLLRQRGAVARGALVFGREESGMEGAELELCHFLWSLPTSPDFPSLNLVQAVGIALAGMADAHRRVECTEDGLGLAPSRRALNPLAGGDGDDAPATHEEILGLENHLRELMAATGWSADRRADNAVARLRNLLARGGATRNEVSILRGVCRRAIRQIGLPQDPE